MNKKHLNKVIDKYISRFDELNDDNHDEAYKWRAVSHFKKNWDINALDFAEMFKNSMSKTYNLIESSHTHPIGAIQTYLKDPKKVETVREAFGILFSDDNGDLYERWNRAERFKAKMNSLAEESFDVPGIYMQDNRSAIFYLNLWRPEENYMYKATEAGKWADHMDFADDFGGGQTFNLAKYYKMCDQLMAEIIKDEELLALHKKRADKEMIGYDDELHILIYDIIYCAGAYNFYIDLPTPEKTSAKERAKRAEKREMQEKLEQELAEIALELDDLKKEAVAYPTPCGVNVKHKTFGQGVISGYEMVDGLPKRVIIDFAKSTKKLGYPSAVKDGFLQFDDIDSFKGDFAAASEYDKKEAEVNRRMDTKARELMGV